MDLRTHVLSASDGAQRGPSADAPAAAQRAQSAGPAAMRKEESDTDFGDDESEKQLFADDKEGLLNMLSGNAIRRDKESLRTMRRALEVEREKWRMDMRTAGRSPEERRVLKEVKKRLDLCARRLNEAVQERRAEQDRKPPKQDLADKWK